MIMCFFLKNVYWKTGKNKIKCLLIYLINSEMEGTENESLKRAMIKNKNQPLNLPPPNPPVSFSS